jgi:hypothetical protein
MGNYTQTPSLLKLMALIAAYKITFAFISDKTQY